MNANPISKLVAITSILLNIACPGRPSPAPLAQQNAPQKSESKAGGPFEELAHLDPRTPVLMHPMMAWHQKQNMMDHLVAIQRITEALARKDWKAIEQAATQIESSPQMQQTCQHMGASAPGFTELALEFHHRADAIGAAARAFDEQAVLQSTSETLKSCTTCHAAFRQDVVSMAQWEQRTGQAGAHPVHRLH